MAISLVSANDTFQIWINRTNEISQVVNGLLDGTGRIANTSITGPLLNFVSNSTSIVVSGGHPALSNTVYLDATITISTSDVSTSNIASANSVNATYRIANGAYIKANTACTQSDQAGTNANNAYGAANTVYAAANTASDRANTAYGQANNAYNQANNAYINSNTANLTANTSLTTAQAAYARGNTSAQLVYKNIQTQNTQVTRTMIPTGNANTIIFNSGYGFNVDANTLNNTITFSLANGPIYLGSTGSDITLDAFQNNTFYVTLTANVNFLKPLNAVAGQKILIVMKATGGAKLPIANTQTGGGFRFSTDIPAWTAIANTKTDYWGAIYNPNDTYWDIISYVKGY